MKKLSISIAWNEAVAFITRESALIFPVALALVALPSYFLQLLVPVTAEGQQPEPGLWMLLLIPVFLVVMLGTLTLSTLALRPGLTVGQAIAASARRLPVLAGAALIIAAIALAIITVFVILIAALMGDGPNALVLSVMVAILIFVFLSIRLSVLNAVCACENLGAAGILARSFTLTRAHFARLAGFFAIYLVITFLVMFVLGLLGSLILAMAGAGDEGSGLTAHLVGLVTVMINTIISVYFTIAMARVYAQLAD